MKLPYILLLPLSETMKEFLMPPSAKVKIISQKTITMWQLSSWCALIRRIKLVFHGNSRRKNKRHNCCGIGCQAVLVGCNQMNVNK